MSKLRSSQPEKDCFIVLIGTKLDVVKEDSSQRQVEYDAGQKLSEKIEAIGYFETSSKTGENIDILFDEIVKNLIKHPHDDKGSNTVTLTRDDGGNSGGGICCGK